MAPPKKPPLDLDVEAICERIAQGETLEEIQLSLKVSARRFWGWIDGDAETSARVRGAQVMQSHWHADQAGKVLKDAQNPFELAKGRELSQYHKWKSKVLNPKRYGDKVTHQGDEDQPFVVKADLTLGPSEAYMRMLNK